MCLIFPNLCFSDTSLSFFLSIIIPYKFQKEKNKEEIRILHFEITFFENLLIFFLLIDIKQVKVLYTTLIIYVLHLWLLVSTAKIFTTVNNEEFPCLTLPTFILLLPSQFLFLLLGILSAFKRFHYYSCKTCNFIASFFNSAFTFWLLHEDDVN